MAIEVKMPQLGESVHEGTIGTWLKAEGDTVEKYEPLLEVITDKVDTEVTAADGGTLLRIVVPEGETVTVGTVLAYIGEAGEAVDAASAASPGTEADESAVAAPAPSASASASAPAPAPASGAPARVSPVAARMAAEHGVDPASVQGSGRGGQVTRQDVERHLAATEAGGDGASAPADDRGDDRGDDIGFISPRVARLAAQHGVDLRRVSGSGRDGRITARDVERYVESGAAEAAPEPTPTPAPVPAPEAAPREAAAVPATRPAAAPASIVGEIVELTPMRRSIADHMVRSMREAPHVSTIHEADMSNLMAAYRRQKDAFAERGDRLTITALLFDALSAAIAEHPMVNSSWTDEGIQLHRDVNIGMAVAIKGGLIVPVIKQADEKNLVGLAREINDLADRARSRRLSPDDVQGGTFTVTNYGTLGSLFGTPVINQPQAAILGVGAIKKRVVVVEGPDGDQIAIRPMMYLALTFDHRILDGGTADPFMRSLVERLESYGT